MNTGRHTGAKQWDENRNQGRGIFAAPPSSVAERPNSATAASDKMAMIRDEQRAAEKPVYGCQTREEWLPGWLGVDVLAALLAWTELWGDAPVHIPSQPVYSVGRYTPSMRTQADAFRLAQSILDKTPAKIRALSDIPSQIEAVSADKKPAVLPQSLQSAADVLVDVPTAPAKRKNPTVARKHDKPVLEMAEALQYAIEHWDNVDAHRLPGSGYLVYKSPQRPVEQQIPEEKMGSYWIWRHRNLADRVVVGMRDLKTGQPAYVAPLDDIADYMTKAEKAAKSGMPPFSTSTSSTDGKRSRRGVPAPAGLATVNS